ncbi:hypothetical protein A2422_04275 [Candidatus Woesebacteria bacterium RIFOXYC1_FULL_31_51]|uniref:Uncharacterized protein n=1 Tax=Candidatus Woesebacteria bacterium GW2011_GWC2_31_9 TaxID=1618586 RepID=A0A0G0BK55_9BACT|nr:MAG: hypothetical protein UR17_C0001G0613 [Candidatus Woesebacteria bacterium GW2011_GWF1_31_35]KKP22773.1 MAG: hypothetical protein UR11_C0002G0153 [Candidatus Woesebacteria bacterium GW2011_GWC1_30_29]KKP26739.1 MAG: hypothetical protein UR13_C0003G0106 [Candidatus Woesebacteria bacterium GW2011_GWD1_31_12]KKP28021.1 MAG: hypothetical protein UR16_C0001G0042 [Candidatus Woesebacteria bacterium GW2011_GWB1_31_29]KKP31437.1 MAG: hypothetical protein UR21_C0009G0018 [Candidatus Woesebacteria 
MKKYLLIIFLGALTLSVFTFINRSNPIINVKNTNQSPSIKDSSQAECPFFVDKNFPKEYFSNVFNEVMVSYPPSLITSNQEIIPIKERFNPLKEPFGGEFYTIPKGAYPWTERNFDLDNDEKKERILSADTAMNHTPNLAVIVKDGYIIYKTKGANVYISEVGDHNGFFLHENTDWNSGEYKTTRYVHKDEKFIPVWFQTSCVVRPQSD